MSVETLNRLHQTYIDLSERFKAAWTYQQFLQGLGKLYPDEIETQEAASFQVIYANLKHVSQNLNSTDAELFAKQLDDIDLDLSAKIDGLVAQDYRVAPSLLRRFFGRVKSYDDKILAQLLKFYVQTQRGKPWTDDRLDKADYLLTRLGEEVQDPGSPERTGELGRLREILGSVWKAYLGGDADRDLVRQKLMEISTLRDAIGQAKSLDEFNELGLVSGYRSLKHSLGALFFEPTVAEAVVETNLLLRGAIERFYQMEERRIAAEYQEVFELEREAADVDPELEGQLRQFRNEIEDFEHQLESQNVRLSEVAKIRDKVRYLVPRLRDAGQTVSADLSELTGEDEFPAIAVGDAAPLVASDASEPAEAPAADAAEHTGDSSEAAGQPDGKPEGSLRIRTAYAALLSDGLRQLLKVLELSDWQASPDAVATTPEAQPLRIQPREVVAFRRLHTPDSCDAELEQFLLEASALRLRISREAEEIVTKEHGGDPAGEELRQRAQITCSLASDFEHRFNHFLHECLQSSRIEEARGLQDSRMRLLRDYSGLWILIYG